MIANIRIGLIIVLATALSFGQSSVKSKKHDERKIADSQPDVYITFTRYEDYRPEKTGVKHRLAWVRIHNNMREPIRFCSYDESVSPNGKTGATFELEKIPDFTNSLSRDNSLIPFGMIGSDMCNEFTLQKGSYFDFALVVDKYLPNTRIKIAFYYDWEDVFKSRTGNEPEHFIYFYLRDLP